MQQQSSKHHPSKYHELNESSKYHSFKQETRAPQYHSFKQESSKHHSSKCHKLNESSQYPSRIHCSLNSIHRNVTKSKHHSSKYHELNKSSKYHSFKQNITSSKYNLSNRSHQNITHQNITNTINHLHITHSNRI